jgi:hypothetical protein
MKKLVLLLSVSLFSVPAVARDYYQAGSQWDKRLFTEADLATASPATVKAAMALGHVRGGATAFYIGKFAGRHLGATNHHVYPFGCQDEPIQFEFLKKTYICARLIGTWADLDLTIFSLRVPPEDEAAIEGHALKFAFKEDVVPGQKLVTIGYGHHRNPNHRPMIDEGPDCMVLSGKNDFRHKAESGGHGTLRVWSISHGCESSQGDSGSAILDRETGKVVAILWDVTENRPARLQDTAYLESLTRVPNDDDIWNQMNYAGAMPKAYAVIKADVENPASSLNAIQRDTLRALLAAD